MFSLVKDFGVQVALKQEALPFVIAFLIAEVLFKFKSFTLECLAFLATWFVLSFIQSLVFGRSLFRNRNENFDRLGLLPSLAPYRTSPLPALRRRLPRQRKYVRALFRLRSNRLSNSNGLNCVRC